MNRADVGVTPDESPLRGAASLFEVVLVPIAIVPIGWPAVRLGPPRRIPVAQKVHRERYGNPS